MEDSAHVPPPIPDSSLIDSIDLHVEPVSLSLCLLLSASVSLSSFQLPFIPSN